jgi:hypothetical protein
MSLCTFSNTALKIEPQEIFFYLSSNYRPSLFNQDEGVLSVTCNFRFKNLNFQNFRANQNILLTDVQRA